MGRKKATRLKPETKQLLKEHIDSASAAPTPNSQLFFVDKAPKLTAAGKRAAAAAEAKAKAKQSGANAAAGVKRKRGAAEAEAEVADADSMDTSADAAPAEPFFHDSDEEEVGYVTRNSAQLRAHAQEPARLENPRESQRLRAAQQTKARKEAEAAQAKPALFDLWATDLEADLQQGIRAPTDEKGFRTGPAFQSRFRRRGAAKASEGVKPSTLKDKIHEGASFHPDYEAHQGLLRTVLEKDEAERAEIAAIKARFHVPPPTAEDAAPAADAPQEEEEDDSWMDDDPAAEAKKNPPTSSVKFSQRERNRLKRAEENRQKQAAAKAEKELGKFVNRIPVVLAEFKKKAKLRAREKARIETLKRVNPTHEPRLGSQLRQPAFPSFALTEDLPDGGSMRRVRPSGDVVAEQFARFEERHLIEARKKVKRTKGTVGKKSYDRFKDEQQPTAPQAKKRKVANE